MKEIGMIAGGLALVYFLPPIPTIFLIGLIILGLLYHPKLK